MPSFPPSSDDPNELFDRITPRDKAIGTVRRGDAHANPALWHRSVQVLVFASDARLLLQRRSARKDLFPNFYCASASGHVAAGDGYAVTARRELREELGITAPLHYAGKRVVRSPTETEMTALYLARSDGPFAFHPTETAGGAFFSLAEVIAARESGSLPMTPALLAALDMLAAPRAAALLVTLLGAAALSRIPPAATHRHDRPPPQTL